MKSHLFLVIDTNFGIITIEVLPLDCRPWAP